MKKKVVAGLVAITALSMIVGGCGVNFHVGTVDENTSSEESSNESSSDEEEESDSGIKFNKSMSLTFNMDNGDKATVKVTGYGLSGNEDNDAYFDIKDSDKVIATGCFIDSDMYDSYYGTIKDYAKNIEVINFNGDAIGAVYCVDGQAGEEYDTLGWINGTNLGFLIAAMKEDAGKVKDAIENLTFEVESNSGDGVDKVTLPEKAEVNDVYEDSSSSDEAVSNENVSDNVVVPDGFEVNYECEYFTDYDKGDITVRINHGDYDEEVNQFLKGNPDYLDAATLSDAGTYKIGDREVQAIKSDGHIDDMDTGYVKYYFVGDGVNASIYNRVNDELTVEDAEELVSEFYE